MRFTKKIFKIQRKSSCGHYVEHMAGNISDLPYTSLSSRFWAKPLFNCDDKPLLHPLHLYTSLLGRLKRGENPKLCQTLPCRPPSLTFSLASLSQQNLVLEHLQITRILTMHGPGLREHGIGQARRAQHDASACLYARSPRTGRARAPRARSPSSSPTKATTASRIPSTPSSC